MESISEIKNKIAKLVAQRQAAIDIQKKIEKDIQDIINYVNSITGPAVENPTYVTSQKKRELLKSILESHGGDKISFQEVKNILEQRYNIKTRTIGNFFRNELGKYNTTGGNRKKFILIGA